MLPAALITIFLFEIAYALAFGYFMWGNGMMQRLDELSICILIYLVCIRVALVLASFLAAHLLNPSQPPLRIGRRFRMMLRESMATIFAFTVLIPLSFVFAPRLKGVQTSTVVLMVHGFMSNSGIWWWVARALRQKGIFGIDSLNLTPVFGNIDQYARQLDQHIARLRTQGVTDVLLVGHSMGGLVCRSWLQARPESSQGVGGLRCQLLTQCTPWQGTRLARFLPWRNLAELAHHSPWVLAHSEGLGIPALSLYSAHDNVVIPYTAGLDHSINSGELRALGHLSVLFEAQVVSEIALRCSSRPSRQS